MVNCLSTEEMYDFIDGQLEESTAQIDTHIQSCATCSALFEELLETEHAISTMFSPVNVEAAFTNQVMDQLSLEKTVLSKKRDWRAALATVFVTAALLFLVFSILQKESSTSSSSVTIIVKEVKVTDALIEVTLATSGYNGDELFFNKSNEGNVNDVSLVLPNGETELIGSYAETSTNEITYVFPLFDVPYPEFKLVFDFKHIYDIDGQWSFEVPINRQELLAKTENITLHSSFKKDGIDVNFIRAQHGPYNSIFKFETNFTDDMATFVEQQVAQYTADLPLTEKDAYVGYNAQILYDVINADGKTLKRSIPEDTISIQNDRLAHTETLSTYPSIRDGGYLSVIGAKFELPTNVRHALTVDQLPYSFTYKGTTYEVKLQPDQSLEISSDAKSTTISSWDIKVNHKTAWDTARFRTDKDKTYTTFTLNKDIQLDSFILYGQTETKFVYFDEPIDVDVH
ncbi:anti-sigma factor family protein [Lysinibacillus sp. NPDC094177]|uniref:anti-sigma factor family protein n=1 Tax=Lysinibacillus sp. NPDC094177 TaxID=3390580 RepID=UPI003D087E81